jgi:hypothetical protein
VIVRQPTKNPTCPDHPRLDVEIAYHPPLHDTGVWVCSACNRPLGLAVLGGHDRFFGRRFPKGRAPKPSEPAWGVIDFAWFYPAPRSA